MSSIPRSNQSVNAPVPLDSLYDGDYRLTKRAERLAMTAAQVIRAAENRYQAEYGLDIVYQGGYGRVEVVSPYHDPSALPWVHLLPVGWRQTVSGSWMRTYLVRGTGQQYGAPDWAESERMLEHAKAADATTWLTEYREWIKENPITTDLLEDMS